MSKRQAPDHFQDPLHSLRRPSKRAKPHANPGRNDQSPSRPLDALDRHVVQASDRESASPLRTSRDISPQAAIQDGHGGNSDEASTCETAPSVKEETVTERRATWRQQVREASTRSRDQFREVQEAYKRFRQSHGRLLSPTLSDDESENTFPDEDADEYGFTPVMLGLEDERDPRIDEVFGNAYARHYRAQVSNQPAAQPWRPIGMPFSPPTVEGGWPVVYKQPAQHGEGRVQIAAPQQTGRAGNQAEQPREPIMPKQTRRSTARSGLSTPGARELLSSRKGAHIQGPRRMMRHSREGYVFYELNRRGQPRPVVYR